MNPQELPVCLQERRDCFAYKYGRCLALHDTEFIKDGMRYKCPFYKQKKIGERK